MVLLLAQVTVTLVASCRDKQCTIRRGHSLEKSMYALNDLTLRHMVKLRPIPRRLKRH